MIKPVQELRDRGIEVDLTGPDGNAFALLGLAIRLALECGKDWPAIQARMTSSDYENLLAVFEAEFGDLVTLYR